MKKKRSHEAELWRATAFHDPPPLIKRKKKVLTDHNAADEDGGKDHARAQIEAVERPERVAAAPKGVPKTPAAPATASPATTSSRITSSLNHLSPDRQKVSSSSPTHKARLQKILASKQLNAKKKEELVAQIASHQSAPQATTSPFYYHVFNSIANFKADQKTQQSLNEEQWMILHAAVLALLSRTDVAIASYYTDDIEAYGDDEDDEDDYDDEDEDGEDGDDDVDEK